MRTKILNPMIVDFPCCYSALVDYVLDRQGIIKDRVIIEKLLSLHISRQYIRTKHLKELGITLTKARRLISSCREVFIENALPIGYNDIQDVKRRPAVIKGKDFLYKPTSNFFEVDVRLRQSLSEEKQIEEIKKLKSSDRFELINGKIVGFYKNGSNYRLRDNNLKYEVFFRSRLSRKQVYDLYCTVILFYRERWKKKYKLLDSQTFEEYLTNGKPTRNYHLFNFLREISGIPTKKYKKLRVLKIFTEIVQGRELTPLNFSNFVAKEPDQDLMRKHIEDVEEATNIFEDASKHLILTERSMKKDRKSFKNKKLRGEQLEEYLAREKTVAEEKSRVESLKSERYQLSRVVDLDKDSAHSGFVENYTVLALKELKTKSEFEYIHDIKYKSIILRKTRVRAEKRKRRQFMNESEDFSKPIPKRQDRRRFEQQNLTSDKPAGEMVLTQRETARLTMAIEKVKRGLKSLRKYESTVYLDIVRKGCLKLAEMWDVECPNNTELMGVFDLWAIIERTREQMMAIFEEDYSESKVNTFIEAGRRWGVELTDF
jgi:hypothetical protein